MPQFRLNRSPYVKGDEPGVRTPHPFYALDDFAKGYVEAMFFTNGDTGDEKEDKLNELGVERLTKASVAAIKSYCGDFLGQIMPDGCFARQWINRAESYDDEQAGRDLWFTAQGHGVGFWDRKELELDLFEPSAEQRAATQTGGWRADGEGPCKGTIGEGLTEAAKKAGERYVEHWRGWIHFR